MTPLHLQSFTQFLNNTFRRLVQAWVARLNRARHIAELRAMNDRELSDLGICRADIETVVGTEPANDETRRFRGAVTGPSLCDHQGWSNCPNMRA